jgi:ribonuclease HI
MSEPSVLTINTDGASRGNPGPAAFAYVINRVDQPPVEEAGCLGRMTNNMAEYTALVRALEHALRLGPQYRVIVRSDSELMVKQMRGEYRVKDDRLRALYDQACRLRDRFQHRPQFLHVRREQNTRADALCNEVLDGRRLPSPRPEEFAPPTAPPADALREKAVTCLRRAAERWVSGNGSPAPEAVWDELLAILKEAGMLRRTARAPRRRRLATGPAGAEVEDQGLEGLED